MARDHLIELSIQAKDDATAKIEGVANALDGLGEDEVTINLALRAAELQGQIDEVRVAMSSLDDEVELQANAEQLVKLTAELEAVEDKIQSVNGIDVEVDAGSSVRTIEDLEQSLDQLETQAAQEIRLNVEANRAAKDIRDLEKEIDRLIRTGADEVEIRAKVDDLARARDDLEELKKLAADKYEVDVNIRQGGRGIQGAQRDLDGFNETGQRGIGVLRGVTDELGAAGQAGGVAANAFIDGGEAIEIFGRKAGLSEGALGKLSGAVAGIGIAVGLGVAAWSKWQEAQAAAAQRTEEVTQSLVDQADALEGIDDTLDRLTDSDPILAALLGEDDDEKLNNLVDVLAALNLGIEDAGQIAQRARQDTEGFTASLLKQQGVPEKLADEWASAAFGPGEFSEELVTGAQQWLPILDETTASVSALNEEFDFEQSARRIAVLTNETERLNELIQQGLTWPEIYEEMARAQSETVEASKRTGEEMDRARREVDKFAAAEQAAARQAEALAEALRQADLDDFISNTGVRRAEAFGAALGEIDATDVGEPFRAARDQIRDFAEYVKSDDVNIGKAIANSLDGSEFSDKFIAAVDEVDDALQTGLVAAFESGGKEGALGFYDSFVADLESAVGSENAAAIMERAGFTEEEVEARIKVAVDRQALDDVVALMTLIGVDSPEARQLLIDVALGDISATDATLQGYSILADEGYDIPLSAYVEAEAVATTEGELEAITTAARVATIEAESDNVKETAADLDGLSDEDREAVIEAAAENISQTASELDGLTPDRRAEVVADALTAAANTELDFLTRARTVPVSVSINRVNYTGVDLGNGAIVPLSAGPVGPAIPEAQPVAPTQNITNNFATNVTAETINRKLRRDSRVNGQKLPARF